MARHTSQSRCIRGKKLIALGRHWASGGQGKQIADVEKLWGIQGNQSAPVEVWPEHAEPFRLFTQCETQWRVLVGMGGARYQGIDYTALHSLMQIHGVADMPHCLECVQALERGALQAFNQG